MFRIYVKYTQYSDYITDYIPVDSLFIIYQKGTFNHRAVKSSFFTHINLTVFLVVPGLVC